MEKPSNTVRPPKAQDTPWASATILPERVASWMAMDAWPVRSRRARRSSRIALSARTRPSLRVRRALMPWRIQASSRASFLSNSAHCFSSASKRACLRSRKRS